MNKKICRHYKKNIALCNQTLCRECKNEINENIENETFVDEYFSINKLCNTCLKIKNNLESCYSCKRDYCANCIYGGTFLDTFEKKYCEICR